MPGDEDQTFYYGDDDDDSTDAENADANLEELEHGSKHTEQKNYTVLTESDILHKIENSIHELCSVFSISKHEASTLLRHYNWSSSKVHDALFADEAAVRKKVGLLDDQNVRKIERKRYDCGICFESYSRKFVRSLACGHSFCCECWSSYISTSINDGPVCLTLRCPEPSCVIAVSDDIVNELSSDGDRKKYNRFLARSYVENNNKKRKWCPAPGCDFAINFEADNVFIDVMCECSHCFCWNCEEEKHHPVECGTVEKWMKKKSSEYENETWKKAYTKQCPKCRRDIEKNMGCMHMSCPQPCGHQFCWICLQDWKQHSGRGSCNRYEESDSKEKRTLKEDLRRYQHYYERWAANEKSQQIAMIDYRNVKDKLVNQIRMIQCQSQADVDFLTEAWKQIVECRQVLKWTYAYGYYLPEKEKAKKEFFEFEQGHAEYSLERLHDVAEQEVKKFAVPGTPSIGEFGLFRRKLIELTRAAKRYFDNLVRALENELSDIKTNGQKASDGASTSVAKKSRRGRATSPEWTHPRTQPVPEPQGPWICQVCTYNNPEYAETCEVCLRGSWQCKICTYANGRNEPFCEMCNEPR